MTLADRLDAALRDGMARPTALLARDADVVPTEGEAVPAAVLFAVTDRPEPGVILTRRNEAMRRHAGQIALPGGRLDPGEDAVAAALREADEEIALPASHVTLIGAADPYRTGTGYIVTPVIGVVPPHLPLRPAEAEVAEVFEVPLAFLLDPANHVDATLEWQGRARRIIEIRWQDRRIWGATAAMIVNLSRRLRWTG